MQKLYAMFPAGMPGLALLLLRLSVGLQTTVCCAIHNRAGFPAWVQVLAAAAAMMLALGYLTPLFAALCGLLQVLSAASMGWPPAWTDLFLIADAAALVLLGPGAYSIDARLFGRRVVVLSGSGSQH